MADGEARAALAKRHQRRRAIGRSQPHNGKIRPGHHAQRESIGGRRWCRIGLAGRGRIGRRRMPLGNKPAPRQRHQRGHTQKATPELKGPALHKAPAHHAAHQNTLHRDACRRMPSCTTNKTPGNTGQSQLVGPQPSSVSSSIQSGWGEVTSRWKVQMSFTSTASSSEPAITVPAASRVTAAISAEIRTPIRASGA